MLLRSLFLGIFYACAAFADTDRQEKTAAQKRSVIILRTFLCTDTESKQVGVCTYCVDAHTGEKLIYFIMEREIVFIRKLLPNGTYVTLVHEGFPS
jgi:hypothetical protein